MSDAIARLLKPSSIAVIGASADATKTSGRPVAYLRKHGFTGKIFPVNPRADAIMGLRCYPDLKSLPCVPDVGVVLLGSNNAHRAVRELSEMGARAAVVLASGYAETGEDGVRKQAELMDAAGGMRLLGPNTIGLVNLTEKITLSASGALEMDEFCVGAVGVVSQSGGILGALLSRAAARGIGLSKLISTGNEADLDISDFVEHLADDPDTKVIAAYIESVRDAKKFRAAIERAAKSGKPVVAYKVGRSEAGMRAASSHTGALAGSDRMYDAFFESCGVIRARTFSNLLDISCALSSSRRLRGKRVATLTSTGGAGTLICDSLGVAGFESPDPDEATARKLRGLVSGEVAAMDTNPIDVTLAGLQPDILRKAIGILFESPTYDALVIIVGSSGIGQPELMADALQQCLPLSDKPVIAYLSPHAPRAGSVLTARGVPAFTEPEACAAALEGMWVAVEAAPRVEPAASRAPISIDDLPSGPLDEAQAKSLFARFGAPSTREVIVASAAEAARAARELGGRVALKILSAKIAHKSDVGGVAIGLDADSIGARLERMRADVSGKTGEAPARFLVQEMVSGVEMILGCQRDALGVAILVGMGGVNAEVLRDTVLRMPCGDGLSREEARSMVRALRSFPLLDGYRGRPKADIEALIDAIVAFSAMCARLGDRLLEAEINPLFVGAEGEGARAADAVATLK